MTHIPLSEKMRPHSLKEIAGQNHITNPTSILAKSIENNHPLSILLYGPPGCGKTTIARIYANAFSLSSILISGAHTSITDFKKMIADKFKSPLFHSSIIVFVDELHRYNKAQQDVFLPLIEEGKIILIGATTENPSFNINNALLSRMRILNLNPLSDQDSLKLLEKLDLEKLKISFDEDAKTILAQMAQGDGRYLWNLIESLLPYKNEKITPNLIEQILDKKAALYDKNTEEHHRLISAFHKSIRGSDPDAAIYWLNRMLNAGEDPLYILRRLLRIASEEVGLADPNALQVALTAYDAFQKTGYPEGEIFLAQATIYIALSPKSNAVYKAFNESKQFAEKTDHLPPPKTIINAPTKLMKEQGFAEGYIYDHDTPHSFSGQNYFPESLSRPSFYKPKTFGFEKELEKRIQYFLKLRQAINQK